MNLTPLLFAITLAATAACPLAAQEAHAHTTAFQDSADNAPVRNIEEWDIKKNKPAIDGYDPVAYFPESGGKATKGKKDLEYTHKGVTYRFASQSNLDAFKKDPKKYEPAHGTWCSWAMTTGDKTEADPKTFIVKDGRLFLFYNSFFGNTKKDWLKGDHDALANKADASWKKISGEGARTPETKKEG